MDNHDKAHYGIAGLLAAGGAALFAFMPAKTSGWPSLSPETASAVVSAMADISPKREVGIYCGDQACTKISRTLVAAGNALKSVKMDYEPLLAGADNLQVGAPTAEEASKMADAVEKASGGVLKVTDAFGKAQGYYLSFGHIAAD